MAFTPDSKRAYVSNERSNTVVVVDPTTQKIVETIAVGERPVGIAILPNGKKAYVAHERANDVRMY